MAASSLQSIEIFSGEKKNNSYIVKFKDGVARDAQLSQLQARIAEHDDKSLYTITHADWAPSVLNGFAGTFEGDALNALRADPDVEYIVEDGIFHINAITQTDAPWGLQRICQAETLSNQDANALTYSYTYDDSAGSGVDIYIVDTGIYFSHSEFAGRARWGKTFGNYADVDGNGHGTHVSGTAAGNTYGVAKKANLIAVKVLGDDGRGTASDIISGLDWVSKEVAVSGRPSIASLSLGGGPSTALDNVVTALTRLGIHVTVAVGNANTDGGSTSPARAPSVVTVGASDISDARAKFSNYGSVVDIFAPGQDVISSWIGGTSATKSISGTSMATPHIAGLIATIISRDGNSSPAAITTKLQKLSTKDALTSIPPTTFNGLARNQV
ncbi:serine protease [Trametes gibbosa]|nr:serine protease [Trametes gibbosa]